MPDSDFPTISFTSQKEFHAWLDKNHDKADGLWLRLYKKATNIPSITIPEALEEVLCYGWIDGIRHSYDKDSYIQKYTPRRAKSVWSKINVGHIERLTKEGRMKPAGIAAVEAAKADGRWQKAYDSPKDMKVPADFLEMINKDKDAKAFFETLNKQNTFAIAFRLHNAKKPETRVRRMEKFLEMMKNGEKFY